MEAATAHTSGLLRFTLLEWGGGGWQIIFSKLGHDIIATTHPPMLFHNAILAFLYEKVGFSSSPFKSRLAL